MKDPKQLLLMHAEKLVLAVMLLLLILVLWVYEPWGVQVDDKGKIADLLRKKQAELTKSTWDVELVVPPYAKDINDLLDSPWLGDQSPALIPQTKLIFWNLSKKGVWVERAPEPPPVIAATAVYAKADRGQAVIVFQIDEAGELRALGNTAVPDYQNGVEFDRIEIYRVDRSAPNSKPLLITPKEGWLPPGLPVRYGAPAGEVDYGPRSLFGVPVYIYSQGGPTDAETRRRIEEEMKRRAAELQKAEEERRRMEEAIRNDPNAAPAPTPTRPTPTPTRPTYTPTRPAPRTPSRPAPVDAGTVGWYYFVDQNVDPDGRYEYNVVIVCKNPVYGKYKDSAEKVPETAKSEAARTPAANEIKVPSFKNWYFQGGTSSGQIELGTFKVRSFVGGRREFTPEEINQIVGELSGATTTKAPKPKTVKASEPEGEWVEQNFTVRPGEEIGGKMTVTVGGERREVDFSTGCFLVSVAQDSQVNETHQPAMVPGPGGTMRTEDRVTRMVIPKLRCAYMDKRGVLRTQWQQTAPPMPKSVEKAN